MKYLLLYRGFLKKSLQDVSMQTINKMGGKEEVEKTYAIIPMTGTLEDALREYVAKNMLNTRNTRSMARIFDVDYDAIKRKLVHEGTLPPELRKVSLGLSVPPELAKAFKELAAKQNMTPSALAAIILPLGMERYLNAEKEG